MKIEFLINVFNFDDLIKSEKEGICWVGLCTHSPPISHSLTNQPSINHLYALT